MDNDPFKKAREPALRMAEVSEAGHDAFADDQGVCNSLKTKAKDVKTSKFTSHI